MSEGRDAELCLCTRAYSLTYSLICSLGVMRSFLPMIIDAHSLGGATINRKGAIDVITDGERAFIVCSAGSPKRVGGLGDVLAGASGTYIAWAAIAARQPAEKQQQGGASPSPSPAATSPSASAAASAAGSSPASPSPSSSPSSSGPLDVPSLILAAYGASLFCRELQRRVTAPTKGVA
jgi:hypothetical protein